MRRLQFKFPSQIRISGWDFGSSARAMNQAGGKDSLMTYENESIPQAELGKGLNSTTERKSMSTKTTIKRIALVAVSALGLGSLSTGVAHAATYTDTFSVDKSSITVVAGGTTAASVTAGAIFKISFGNDGTDTDWTLQSGETLTATVVGVPTSVDTTKTVAGNAAELNLGWATMTTDNGNPYGSAVASASGAANGSTSITSGVTTQYNNGSSTKLDNSVFLQVKPASSENDVIDYGTYTIRLRLTSNNGALLVKDANVSVTFVSSASSSGAKLTAASSGLFAYGTAFSAADSTDKYITATITDANGGRLIAEATAGTSTAPALTVDLLDGDGAVVTASSGLAAVDDASTSDRGYSATTGVTAAMLKNGVYGITATSSSFPSARSGLANKIRVRYGAASATGAITISNQAAGAAVISVTATGSTNPSSNNYSLPLTTKSATIEVSGATPGNAYQYSVAYTNVASGDQTPADSTPTVIYADSTGKIKFTVTNAYPVDSASAVVTVSGFSSGWSDQTLTWKRSAATTVTVSLNGAYVALKSTNKFVATVTDAFGAPVSGVVLVPSLSSTSSNYSAAAVYPSVITDANGEASFSLTDAAAVAAGTDSVTFTQVVASGAVSGSSTITYAAAAPVPTALTAYYSSTPNTSSTKASVATLVNGKIYVDGVSSKFAVQIARDNTSAVTVADSKDHLKIKIASGKAGAAITATASTGAYILNSSNKQKSTVTVYADADGDYVFVVGSNATGTNTITFTSGAVTTTASFVTSTALANARTVSLTSAGGEVTAKVTDRYGNGVKGAALQISTSAGTLGNGQKVATYTTDDAGTVTIVPVVNGDATITAVGTDSNNDYASAAGYVTTWSGSPATSTSTKVESTLAAGSDTATFAFAGTSVTSSDSVDAANEATDAANAATDAANAAAEAADAATAAAQDAQAAVAALATQVASLIAGIKAQITTLTNLVIKIQKKVRA